VAGGGKQGGETQTLSPMEVVPSVDPKTKERTVGGWKTGGTANGSIGVEKERGGRREYGGKGCDVNQH